MNDTRFDSSCVSPAAKPSSCGPEILRLLISGILLTITLAFAGLAAQAPAPKASGKAKAPGPPRVVSSFEAEPGAHYPFRQNMYEAVLLSDGRVMAISVARVNRQQTVQGRYSTDKGQTWSAPEDLVQLPQEAGGFGLFERLLDSDGEVHIFFLCDANSGILYPKAEEGTPTRPGPILDIWHVRSNDKVKRWSKPKPIWTGYGSDLLSVTQMRNGRIILPFSFGTPSRSMWTNPGAGFLAFTSIGTYSVTSIYSDDKGETWHTSPDVLSVQTPDLYTYGADEPVIIQLKDGRVWMLLRTQRGRFYESFSKDGARWSPAQPSKLISSDSPAGLIRLKDGSIMLFSNACLRYPYAYGARYVLHGAISQDEGRTWRGFREIVRDPHRNQPPSAGGDGDYGVAYTFPTLTSDGQVLFSNWVEQGNIRRFRLFDPAWLYETRQECDFSKGLDDWSVFGSQGVDLQPHPDKSGAQVLALRKADAAWPAGAVWNFPIGSKGTVRMELMLRPGFGGNLLGLTDHFSVPWDMEDEFYNAFNLHITSEGGLLPNVKLEANRWYRLELNWDTNRRQCRVLVDGKPVGALPDNRWSSGINYLRLRSTSPEPDGGLLLGKVESDVSASWAAARGEVQHPR